jgi:hypothetical protein
LKYKFEMSFTNDRKLGEFNLALDMMTAQLLLQGVTDDEWVSIFETDGMTGVKYRAMCIAIVFEAIAAILGDEWSARSNADQGMILTTILIALGVWFSITNSKRTILKNLGNAFLKKEDSKDPIPMALRVIKNNFRTYVNDPTEQDKFPSVKFPSCMADFVMMGSALLASRIYEFEEVVRIMFIPYRDWPKPFKNSCIGNLALNADAQKMHRDEEERRWKEDIKKSMNPNNKDFKPEFTEEFYKNTETDNILLFTTRGGRVLPEVGDEYTMEEIAMYFILMYKYYKSADNSSLATADNPMKTPAAVNFFADGVGNMTLDAMATGEGLRFTKEEAETIQDVRVAEGHVAPGAGGTEEEKGEEDGDGDGGLIQTGGDDGPAAAPVDGSGASDAAPPEGGDEQEAPGLLRRYFGT